MTFIATRRPIGRGHAAPSIAFLETIMAWQKSEDDSVYAPNSHLGDHDIYNLLLPVLGPFNAPVLRRAAMCECLRVLAGDESDWNWREGRDTTAGPETPAQMETGAFQISYDSALLGDDLAAFLEARSIHNAEDFQTRIAADPILDCAYTARALRDSTRWDGPLNRRWVTSQVSRPAAAEFAQLILTA